MNTTIEPAKSEYDVDFFIRKFEAIPDEKWCVGNYVRPDGRRCAYGHCGASSGHEIADNKECRALGQILSGQVEEINNGNYEDRTGPRARILAALQDVKAKEGK
jgi:hypothetical protein